MNKIFWPNKWGSPPIGLGDYIQVKIYNNTENTFRIVQGMVINSGPFGCLLNVSFNYIEGDISVGWRVAELPVGPVRKNA